MVICDLVGEFVHGELDNDQAQAFRLHLAECLACQEELPKIQRIVATLTDMGRDHAPRDGWEDRVLAQIASAPPRNPK